MTEQENYIQDKTFGKDDLPTKGEYENCIFNSCNFAENDLLEFKFTDCIFNGCNFSLAKLNNTAFRDVKFKDCKMLGFGLTLATSSDFLFRLTVANSIILRSTRQKSKR